MRELRQFEAAEELVRAGLQLQPRHPHLLADFARLAQFRGDWNEALRRWEAARAAVPDWVEVHIGRIGALKALRRFGEALSSLREFAEKFPNQNERARNQQLTEKEENDEPVPPGIGPHP